MMNHKFYIVHISHPRIWMPEPETPDIILANQSLRPLDQLRRRNNSWSFNDAYHYKTDMPYLCLPAST